VRRSKTTPWANDGLTRLCRRALELLASFPTGCTEALLFAYDITVEVIVELVRAGFATAQRERMVAVGKSIEVARVRIIEAGRKALNRAST